MSEGSDSDLAEAGYQVRGKDVVDTRTQLARSLDCRAIDFLIFAVLYSGMYCGIFLAEKLTPDGGHFLSPCLVPYAWALVLF